MSGRISGVLATLSLLLSGYAAFTVYRLDARLAEAPPRVTRASGVGSDDAPRSREPRNRPEGPPDAASEGARAEALDPAVRGQIATVIADEERRRDDERGERMRAAMSDSVERFADDHDLPDDVRGKLVAEIERRSLSFQATREAVHEGDLSWADARAEFDALREGSDKVLRELLGEERAQQFDEAIFGGRDRPWR